jgi:hypothetical protein
VNERVTPLGLNGPTGKVQQQGPAPLRRALLLLVGRPWDVRRAAQVL